MPAPQTDPQYKLRLPEELRDRIAAEAQANNRSMNAEIVARLQSSFDEKPTAIQERIIRRIADEAAKSTIIEMIDTFEATSFRIADVDGRRTLVVDRQDGDADE